MLGGHLFKPMMLILGLQVLAKSETQRFKEEEQVVASYNELARSILPAAKKALGVIREDTSKVNLWDATLPTVFFASFAMHISGIVMSQNMDILDLGLIFWRGKSLASYFILFSLPHMYPEHFGAGSEHLACSLEDANETLRQMRELKAENSGQLAVALENLRIQLRLALGCVLIRGHKYDEAAEVEFLLQQLFDLYNDMHQFKIPAPPSLPDPSSLAHYDQGLVEFRGRLQGLAGGTSAASREAIANKNRVIYEGVAFGAVGIFASAMAIIKGEESVQEEGKKESNVTEWDRARGIIAKGLKLAGAILEGLAYIGLLAVNYESPSEINCGAEDLQQALDEYSLLARPGDIIPTTGSLAISERMVDDLGRAFKRNLNCVFRRAESFELFSTIESYLILLTKRIAAS